MEPQNLRFKVVSTEKVEGYKPSRFNVRAEDKNSELLLLNTFTGKMSRVAGEHRAEVEQLLRNPNNIDHSSEIFQQMLGRGYLVSKDVDEYRRAALLHNETISNEGNLELILMPNEDCNFRCKYCYESFAKNFMKPEIQEGIIHYIRRNIHRYSSITIQWFGGEPLTAISIVESLSQQILAICRENQVAFKAMMTTNGYNLTLDVLRKMLACRISVFQITLDGLSESHDNQRVRADGAGTFNQIIDNLRTIRDNVKSKAFKILVRTNVTKPILDQMGDYIEFIKQEFGSDMRFGIYWQVVGDYGGDVVKEMADSMCTYKDMIPALEQAASEGLDLKIYRNYLNPEGSVCYASKRNSFVIGSDGIVYKCTVAFNDERNQVGYLTREGKMYIDRDKFALWVTGHETTDSGCQKCFFRPSCQGASCPYARLIRDESPCPPTKTYIKSTMRILGSYHEYLGAETILETER